MKAIGVKMVDIMPMSVSMALEHGYRVGNANPNDMGYEITYPDGYKFWCPKDVADASYFYLSPENDGTKILDKMWIILLLPNVEIELDTKLLL
jgi:hypothetical protein